MALSPKSLILDLLSTLRRGSFPVGGLVAAGACFGLEEGSVRVALARLLEAGLVERAERGRYRLGARAGAVQGRVVAWRAAQPRTRAWMGGFVGVLPAAGAGRGSRQRSDRALRFLGFRPLRRTLQVRPDNLVGGLAAVRAALQDLGLGADALVFELDGLDAAAQAHATALWDVAALQASWRTCRRALEASERRLPRLSRSEAMAESFLVGGRALRELALDPLLPEAIAPIDQREALVAAMRRYDHLGRACWAAFREEHGVLSPRTPADTRGAARGAGFGAPETAS